MTVTKNFHEKHFDDATLLKLEIFRDYVRQWLPVFLSKKSFPEVHIYDFFAGPGTDNVGNAGSPFVIIDELEKYLKDDRTSFNDEVKVTLHFNDIDCTKIDALEDAIRERNIQLPFELHFSRLDFEIAFENALPSLQSASTANLVIVDQFGIKAVNDKIFETLAKCSATDMLFFISSSFISRFISEESVQKYFPLQAEQIRLIPPKEIHRYICTNFYRSKIPEGSTYRVAPFSIEKVGGSNIYGIIFGSGNLLGLDKFLQVCWNKDKITGEANYDIDDDIIRSGQRALFEEDNLIKKQDKFEQALTFFLREHCPTNNSVYEFTLENGFLPKHAVNILQGMAQRGILKVTDLQFNQPARKNSFYLSWDNYKNAPRAKFELR